MSFFVKLFGRPKRAVKSLEELLQVIGPNEVMQSYHSTTGPSLRLPSVLCAEVLHATHQFCLAIFETLNRLGKSGGALPDNVSYDAVAFETAAYCHYWLMREYLDEAVRNIDDEDHEKKDCMGHNDAGKGDGYFRVLRDSMHLTDSIIRRYTTFNLDKDFFVNRISSYSISRVDYSGQIPKDVASRFEAILASSIENGSPGLYGKDIRFGAPLLELAVKSCSPIFHQILATLKQAGKDLYDRSEKGVL